LKRLRRIDSLEIREDVPLKELTSLRVGGRARLYLLPGSVESAQEMYEILHHSGTSFKVMGNGTNLLVGDGGVDVVVSLRRLDSIDLEGDHRGGVAISAGAGCSLRRLMGWCHNNGLGGIEPLAGIPASVGGAIFMNAGVSGFSISQILDSVLVIGETGSRWVPASEIPFSYRTSGMSGQLICGARFSLTRDSKANIRRRIAQVMTKRVQTQPLGKRSAGCAFKNPDGDFAGRLIEMAGLKGFRRGGAVISGKHANFIINEKNARAEDVLALMGAVQERVARLTGVELEPEITVWD